MTFRPASMKDAACIYVWRRLDESRAWYVSDPTEYEQHLEWLEARIHNPLVQLLVWERDGVASGMVRVDSNGEVAFHGDDPHMLHAATRLGVGRLKATLDADDPKVPLLLQAGFTPYDATALVNGVSTVAETRGEMSGGTITPFDWELDFSRYAIVDRVGLTADQVPTSFLFAYDEYQAGGGTAGIVRYWREWNRGTTEGGTA